MPTRIVWLGLAVAIAACATPQPKPTKAQAVETQRAEVKQRLVTKLESDPNSELCRRIEKRFTSGDQDAIAPDFDAASFVERIIATAKLPADTQTYLREKAGTFEYHSRFHSGNARFQCLGTRTFLSEPHVALRISSPGRFDYLLLHLGADGRVDDYIVISSGFYHSELQSVGMNRSLESNMDVVNTFLALSHEQKFETIVEKYHTLSKPMQEHRVAFWHYLNALHFARDSNDPEYQQAIRQMETIFSGREYALIYWRRAFAQKGGDQMEESLQRTKLVEMLDDYELVR